MKYSSIAVAIFLATTIISVPNLFQESSGSRLISDREKLESKAWQSSWPGGALQHTPFHGGHTTRFLLLKSCTKSGTLAEYLKLSDTQKETVRNLEVHFDSDYSEKLGTLKLYDVEAASRDFYSFLTDEQKARLDAMSFRLDGFVSLLRLSMASKIQLSTETTEKIEGLFWDFRSQYTNPRMRNNFAAKLPDDIEYQNNWWDGATTTYINMKILAVLSDEECERLVEFLDANHESDEVRREIIKICKLPSGVWSLFEYSGLDQR